MHDHTEGVFLSETRLRKHAKHRLEESEALHPRPRTGRAPPPGGTRIARVCAARDHSRTHTPDDTTTASAYTEVSARQAWCFTVGKDNPAEGCWFWGSRKAPLPAPFLKDPAAARGPGLRQMEGQPRGGGCTRSARGRRFALA